MKPDVEFGKKYKFLAVNILIYSQATNFSSVLLLPLTPFKV